MTKKEREDLEKLKESHAQEINSIQRDRDSWKGYAEGLESKLRSLKDDYITITIKLLKYIRLR